MVILCAFIVAGFGAVGLLRRRQFLSFLFVFSYLAMFFPNPFLVSLGVFQLFEVSPGLYALTNAVLIFGLMLFFLGTNIVKSKEIIPINIKIYLNRPTVIFILWLLFLVAGAGIFLSIALGGGLSAFRATRAELAAGYRGLGFRDVTLYMFFPFLVAAPLLITQLSKPLQVIPWIISAILLVLQFMLFRARTPFVTVMVSIAVGILLKNRIIFIYGQPSTKLFKTFRDYLSVAILVLCIFVGGIVITFLRGVIGTGGSFRFTHGFLKVWLDKTFDGGDLGYQRIQRAAFYLYPNPNRYLLGQSYFRVLLIPIPRSIMPNKPLNTSRVFCKAIDPKMDLTGGTVPPGIVGDLYINFGYFGIFGMLLYGLVFGRERYSYLWQWMMLAGSLTWLFHLVRGEFTNSLVTMCVYLIVTRVLDRHIYPDYGVEETELEEEEYCESEPPPS